MWGTNSQNSNDPAMAAATTQNSRGAPEFRKNVVVERVAYAHPVRDHQAYYAPKGKNQYEQRQPPPIPPHPNQNQVGYPFYGGSGYSNSSSGGGVAPQPGSGGSGLGPPDSGRARVRREHNSECVLYDPAESVVVRFLIFLYHCHFTEFLIIFLKR